MSTTSPDVQVARGIRALTASLLACCAAALLLGAGAAAAVAGTAATPGPRSDLVTAGLTLLVLGQAAAIVGAVVVGAGLRAVLAPRADGQDTARQDAAGQDAAGQDVSGRRSGRPGPRGATDDDATRVVEARLRTATRLALAGRLVLVGVVAGVAAWTLAAPGSALGALAGGLVTAQVAVLFSVVARWLAGDLDQSNSTSIRVLPRVFGLTRARSRNSATPSSWDRNNSV